MAALFERSRLRWASALLFPVLAACTVGMPGDDAEQNPQSGLPSIVAFQPEQPVWPPNNAFFPPPSRATDATYVEFESGWTGAAILPGSGETECNIYPRGDTRVFRAWTSEFDQYDSGSKNPGADFWVEVWTSIQDEDNMPMVTGDERASVRLEFVDRDGTHRVMNASSSRAELQVLRVGETGVGFSATSVPSGSNTTVTVTGYVACASVGEYP